MKGLDILVAGKTGTAQVEEGMPHSWFAGFAPYGGDAANTHRVCGSSGARRIRRQLAAPIARDLVAAARDLGIITGGK